MKYLKSFENIIEDEYKKILPTLPKELKKFSVSLYNILKNFKSETDTIKINTLQPYRNRKNPMTKITIEKNTGRQIININIMEITQNMLYLNFFKESQNENITNLLFYTFPTESITQHQNSNFVTISFEKSQVNNIIKILNKNYPIFLSSTIYNL